MSVKKITSEQFRRIVRSEVRRLREAWSERPGPTTKDGRADVTTVIAAPAVAASVDALVDDIVDYVSGTEQEAAMLRDAINDGIRKGLRYTWE